MLLNEPYDTIYSAQSNNLFQKFPGRHGTLLLYRVRPDDGLLFFSAASLCLGGINLLPLPTFDGGRILAAVLCTLMGPDYADPLLAAAEAVGTALIWLIASALILRTGGNITLTVLAALLIWRMMSGYR